MTKNDILTDTTDIINNHETTANNYKSIKVRI